MNNSKLRKVKITLDQITRGPNTPEVDELMAFTIAGELYSEGYRRVSNAYCQLARIDREDWIQVLAAKLNCAPADFYKLDGSGVDDNWRDHYIRCSTTDKITVHPEIAFKVRGYR